MNVKPCTLALPDDVIDALDRVAEFQDRSRSSVARAIFAEALADHAALQREAWRRFENLLAPADAPSAQSARVVMPPRAAGTPDPAAVSPAGSGDFPLETGD